MTGSEVDEALAALAACVDILERMDADSRGVGERPVFDREFDMTMAEGRRVLNARLTPAQCADALAATRRARTAVVPFDDAPAWPAPDGNAAA